MHMEKAMIEVLSAVVTVFVIAFKTVIFVIAGIGLFVLWIQRKQ